MWEAAYEALRNAVLAAHKQWLSPEGRPEGWKGRLRKDPKAEGMSRKKASVADGDTQVDIVALGREKAKRYTKMLKDALRGARTEEDVRLGTYTFLQSLTKEMGVNVKAYHERIVLTGGRIDSLFDNVVFEFKKPGHFDRRAGRAEAIKGRKGKGGLTEYLVSLAVAETDGLADLAKHLSAKIDSFVRTPSFA